MDKTINDIATHVATQLNQAKQKITEGKQQIHDYVVKLPENLRQVGQEAAQDIGGKFDELEQSVDNKQNELVDSLAQKYNENLQQLDAQLEEMKASNRTWMDKAMDAVGGAIKTIVELKNLLLGVLAKAAGAIEMIIKDPIGFLGNLVSGLKQGFENFMGNILEHLKKGMLGWLTGAMAGAGITMPESLDMKGIFSLVTQVLGTVYENIRPRAVKRMGEKAVNFLESNFEMFVILKNEGIAGLWQSIQDQIGDLKVMVIDNIQNFVVDGIIKGGVMWVLSLLNPASAFVKACKAIYDIIMFFIERGSQIAELVNAVMESVTAIASGAVGGAAKLVENALSKALPVVISFMASLLGLGGISEKIQAIVQKVRGPIEKAIDWVIGKAVTFAKKIGGKLGFGKDKKGNKKDKSESDKKHEQLAVQAIDELKKTDGKAKDYKTLRQEKQTQAGQIEQAYTAKLEPGIKLSVHFSDAAQDQKDGDIDFQVVIAPNTTKKEGSVGGGEPVNLKEEVDKASSPEPSYLFRADDSYTTGAPVGFELDSEEATTADIQNPLDHVLNKESGQTSIYVSFSNAISLPGGGGPRRFTKKNKILKVAMEALQQLEAEGKIRIYNPEQVAEMIRQNPKKKISKQANNVKAAMEKNGEILIEGQIPGELIVWAK
jgi:hypothetical protein